jgi:hypothetical protein
MLREWLRDKPHAPASPIRLYVRFGEYQDNQSRDRLWPVPTAGSTLICLRSARARANRTLITCLPSESQGRPKESLSTNPGVSNDARLRNFPYGFRMAVFSTQH